MALYDSIDLNFSWDGDYIRGKDGDLEDTSDDYILSIINEIRNIVKSETLEWEKDPTLGANLADFQGEPNSRETGIAIERRIIGSITNLNIVRSGDLNVRVVPVNIEQVLIIINLNAQPTPGNSLSAGEPVKITLVYDTVERSVFFLPLNQIARAGN